MCSRPHSILSFHIDGANQAVPLGQQLTASATHSDSLRTPPWKKNRTITYDSILIFIKIQDSRVVTTPTSKLYIVEAFFEEPGPGDLRTNGLSLIGR